MTTRLFGIRHHGPGSARSLRTALDAWQPDVVVIEGPADAEEALSLTAHEGLKPPVALLVYPPDEPGDATYYPFAEFSPEWQALRWVKSQNVPVRFMDLPQSYQIALQRRRLEEIKAQLEAAQAAAEAAPVDGEHADDQGASIAVTEPEPVWRADPLTLLAEAAGYKDHELWWEHQVETRRDATDLFAAVAEAMRVVREELPYASERDLLREAFMRRTIRAVRKENFERIAIVCGAWHVPALDDDALDGRRAGCKIGDDEERLRGLPKVKTASTWIPWTHSRLTFRSGYGAGVHSPGWYAHLWKSPSAAPMRWTATAARLLRDADLDASSASVIEAVRLADALAAMRDLRSPGLAELNEAMLSIFCHGETAPLRLIRNRLEVGDVLGEVPDDAPAVPLAQDLARLQKSLRLKPSSELRQFDLDLRNETDLARSRLFHQLNRLGITWGELKRANQRSSTFHELWNVSWEPEYSVKLIEANVWGNTIVSAAGAKIIHDAGAAADLAQIIELLDAALKSGLDDAIEPITAILQTRAAVAADVRQLLDAVLPLARLARYGDVRGTQAEQVEPLLMGLFERACVGLRPACAALDEEAAERMLAGMSGTTQAVDLLKREDLIRDWLSALHALLESGAHALVRGWCCRTLLEKGVLDDAEVERIASRELSPAGVAGECASWATGLLRGSGLVLLHQDRIWRIFDRWLRAFSPEAFVEMLPLIRRAFADFAPAERRQMGEKVKRLSDATPERRAAAAQSDDVDAERAAKVLPVLAQILGVTP
ncbi:MAG: DUF5682 family protein [Pirellulales bacterium]